jgi:DNA-binding response OmpR family regulator
MLSADASREDMAAGLAAGADLYLPKPVEPARLFAALASLSDQRDGPAGRADGSGTEMTATSAGAA